MIDYFSYPPAALRRLVPRSFQVVGHRWNNVAFGIPEPLLSRYWRPANALSGEWTLPDGPEWDELLPYVEAQRLYASINAPTPSSGPPGHAESLAAAALVKEARQAWWAKAYALPGADDPLWRYGAHSLEDADPEFDDIIMLTDYSAPDQPPRYPRRELREKYGTTLFSLWAEQQMKALL